MNRSLQLNPFNTPLETGIRSLTILVAAFPDAFDLQRLVEMDYLVVHSGDAGGPHSLHAPLPLRAGELLVRRSLIEKGLILLMSRGLIKRMPSESGLQYVAEEIAAPFISSLCSDYSLHLRARAEWAVDRFQGTSTDEIRQVMKQFFEKWTSEFQLIHPAGDKP